MPKRASFLAIAMAMHCVTPALAEGRIIYLETNSEAHSNSAPVIRVEDGDTIVLRPAAEDTRPWMEKHPNYAKTIKVADFLVTRLGAVALLLRGLKH